MDIEEICKIIVDTAFKLHVDIGSGLLESAYEAILALRRFAIPSPAGSSLALFILSCELMRSLAVATAAEALA